MKASVLVVEDEGVVAKDVETTLVRLGYSVAGWVTTGEAAIEETERVGPDLVLMDIRLRGEMDGIQAADAIRRRHDTPVVYLTAYADDATLRRATVTEPCGYVVKPFSERELRTAVEVALYKHRADRQLRQLLGQLERSNRDLEDQRGFLAALFHYVPSPMMVVEHDLRVRMVNRIFADEFNLDGNTLHGLDLGLANVLGCPYGDDRTGNCGSSDECRTCGLIRLVRSAFDGTSSSRTRCRMERPNGPVQEISLLVSAAAFEYGKQTLAIVTLEDVTELNGLKRLLDVESSFAGLVGRHPSMLEVYETIRNIADTDVPVMILGESGTGKELVARAIHSEGVRRHQTFVPVNSGAIPDGLLESELFGHVKGAFTGAVRDRKGRFELADGGTIFLDEVGDLSPQMQVKLLRVLQEGTFERVGGEETLSVDVRVVCATNKDLEAEAAAGSFRRDLYYRLCVVPITMPPLRDRTSDVPMLADHLLERYAIASSRSRPELSPDVLQAFVENPWTGNVRELQNALQYALVVCDTDRIELHDLPPYFREGRRTDAAPHDDTGRRVSRRLDRASVVRALQESDGNRTRAAEILGVSRATLYRFLGAHPDLP